VSPDWEAVAVVRQRVVNTGSNRDDSVFVDTRVRAVVVVLFQGMQMISQWSTASVSSRCSVSFPSLAPKKDAQEQLFVVAGPVFC
jgi:hypothetical protein